MLLIAILALMLGGTAADPVDLTPVMEIADTAQRDDLPPAPVAARQVFAGETYTETFVVDCVQRGTADASATVDPPAFPVTLSPTRVMPGTRVTLTAMVPITTPARTYTITLVGIRRSGACSTGAERFTLEVLRPVRLQVEPGSQTIFAGSATSYAVNIRRRTFAGRVLLRTSDLPDQAPNDFRPLFTPPAPTGLAGTMSTLMIQPPANATACGPPNGCVFQIRGMADAQVESTDARIIVKPRQVSLTTDRPAMTVDPGQTADFPLNIVREGYSGAIDFEVTNLEKPAGSVPATRVIPERVTTENQVVFELTTDGAKPGRYRYQVKPKNTGVGELPIVLTVDTRGSAIVLTPQSRTVNPGQNAGYTIEVVTSGGERVDVTAINIAPEGPVSVTFTENMRGILLQSDANTPAGTYKVSVSGFVSENPVGVRPILSNVVDFKVQEPGSMRVVLDADPILRDLQPGQIQDANLSIREIGGYRGNVTLGVSPSTQGGITATIAGSNVVNLSDAMPFADVTIRLQAATNAMPGAPVRFTINATPQGQVTANSSELNCRVVDPTAAKVDLVINPPANNFMVNGGDPLNLVVTVFPRNGCNGEVMFEKSVMPGGALGDFFIPNTIFAFGGFGFSGAMIPTVRVSRDVDVRITVTAMVPGCLPSSASVVGRVKVPPPEPPPLATSTLAPASQTVQRGQSASYALTVSRAGTQGPLALVITGLPPSITAAANPNPINGDTSQITLTTGSAAPTGTFPFTVTAMSNGAPLASASASLTVTAPPPGMPTITSFSPTNGVAGTPVQIVGTNLTNVQNVLFSNGVGAPFAPITPAQVNATVPGFAVTGPITVITSGGIAVSSGSFIVGAQPLVPQITSFTPASGGAGTSVRLQGVNLGGAFDVSFGTQAFGFMPIGFTPFDATRIDVLIPSGVPSGFFRVSTPSGTAMSANAFNVTTPTLPEVGGFNPIQGPPGTRVEIIGANLGNASAVTFGGAPASFEPPQPTRIFAMVPPNAITGQIRVTTPNGIATSFASFAVTSAGGGPVITDFQPRMGSAGFSVTIAGANLGGTNEVTFNGVRAEIGIVTANFVQAFVPSGATTGLIRLTTPSGSASSPFAFTVQP